MLGYTMASDTVVVHRCKFGVSLVNELLVIKLVCLCKVSWDCREANIASGKYLANNNNIPKKTILEKSSFPDIRLQTQESYYW